MKRLPKVDDMPPKKLTAMREMAMIANYGAARVLPAEAMLQMKPQPIPKSGSGFARPARS